LNKKDRLIIKKNVRTRTSNLNKYALMSTCTWMCFKCAHEYAHWMHSREHVKKIVSRKTEYAQNMLTNMLNEYAHMSACTWVCF